MHSTLTDIYALFVVKKRIALWTKTILQIFGFKRRV